MANLVSSPNRLEALSDGVIAVIITIMVLELHVPRQNGLAGLRVILPTLGVYALSFCFVSVYWVNHHHLVHRAEQVDQAILYSNLFFLFSLSLTPFFTAYVIDKAYDSFSVLLYILTMIATGLSFLLLRLAIGRRLRRQQQLQVEDRAAEIKHWASLGLYLLAIPLDIHYPLAALGILVLVMVIWIYPTAPPTLVNCPSSVVPQSEETSPLA
ncbi:MAG: DUF1211 domain-containing protein [Acidobacteriota bacterium]|nr:DUF1211 domain-containing protein [Acidobacteriota bacterium]